MIETVNLKSLFLGIKPPSNLSKNKVSSGSILDRYESFKESIASLNLSLIVSSSLFTRSDDKTLLSVSFVSASSFVTIITQTLNALDKLIAKSATFSGDISSASSNIFCCPQNSLWNLSTSFRFP